jgi:hypothetical protein
VQNRPQSEDRTHGPSPGGLQVPAQSASELQNPFALLPSSQVLKQSKLEKQVLLSRGPDAQVPCAKSGEQAKRQAKNAAMLLHRVGFMAPTFLGVRRVHSPGLKPRGLRQVSSKRFGVYQSVSTIKDSR